MSKGHLLLFAFVCATFVWGQAHSNPARVMGFNRDAKIPRTIRAPFRNTDPMFARGFGKRSQPMKYKETGSPWMLSKSDADTFAVELDPVEQMVSESSLESFPIDWLVDELMSSPVLTRALLTRFVDANKDGVLSAQELLAAGQSQGSSNDRF